MLESVVADWLAAYAVGLAVAQRDPGDALPGSTPPHLAAAALRALERLDHVDGDVLDRARAMLST